MPQPRAIIPESGVRPGLNKTGVDIASRRIVKLKANGDVDEIILCEDADLDVPYGVTLETIKSGYTGDVQIAGKAIVQASAAIGTGAAVTSTTGGKAVATTTGGDYLLGLAVSAAGADLDLFEVELKAGQYTSG